MTKLEQELQNGIPTISFHLCDWQRNGRISSSTSWVMMALPGRNLNKRETWLCTKLNRSVHDHHHLIRCSKVRVSKELRMNRLLVNRYRTVAFDKMTINTWQPSAFATGSPDCRETLIYPRRLTLWKIYPGKLIATRNCDNIWNVNYFDVKLVIKDNDKICIDVCNNTEEFGFKVVSIPSFHSKISSFISFGALQGKLLDIELLLIILMNSW